MATGAIWRWRSDALASWPLVISAPPWIFVPPSNFFFKFKVSYLIVQAIFKMCGQRMSKTINFFFFFCCVPIHNEKLKFMEPGRVRYQVNPPDLPQQFLRPFQKISSCIGTSQMAPVWARVWCLVFRHTMQFDAVSQCTAQLLQSVYHVTCDHCMSPTWNNYDTRARSTDGRDVSSAQLSTQHATQCVADW